MKSNNAVQANAVLSCLLDLPIAFQPYIYYNTGLMFHTRASLVQKETAYLFLENDLGFWYLGRVRRDAEIICNVIVDFLCDVDFPFPIEDERTI